MDGDLIWSSGGPREPTGLNLSGEDGGCCRIHSFPRSWLTKSVGCAQKAVGGHPAVKAAAARRPYICQTTDDTRAADRALVQLYVTHSLTARAYEGKVFQPAQRLATGTAGLESFGKGYCYLVAFPQAFYMRLARVLGPAPLVLDVLKMLCVAGRGSMAALKVTEVEKGFFHVTRDKTVKGQNADAGLRFYGRLVEIARVNPSARVGWTPGVELPRTLPAPPLGLKFGDIGYSREDVLQAVQAFVREKFGEATAGALDLDIRTSTVHVRGKNYVKNAAKRARKARAREAASTCVPSTVSDDFEVQARETLHKKWVAQNALEAAKAQQQLEVLQSRDLEALKKRERTNLLRETEKNLVAVEKAHATLARTGNVPGVTGGFCETVVSDGVSERVVGTSCTISPDSSASAKEFRECQKALLDAEARIKELERVVALRKLQDGETIGFPMVEGSVSPSVREAINGVAERVADFGFIEENPSEFAEDVKKFRVIYGQPGVICDF